MEKICVMKYKLYNISRLFGYFNFCRYSLGRVVQISDIVCSELSTSLRIDCICMSYCYVSCSLLERLTK